MSTDKKTAARVGGCFFSVRIIVKPKKCPAVLSDTYRTARKTKIFLGKRCFLGIGIVIYIFVAVDTVIIQKMQ